MKKILFAFLLVVVSLLAKAGVGIPEVSCDEVLKEQKNVKLIDVRTADEFYSKEGHIEGAKRVTLGPELTTFLKQGNPKDRIIFVCRSGSRSAKAVSQSIDLGYDSTASMSGGMLKWKELGYPTTQKD